MTGDRMRRQRTAVICGAAWHHCSLRKVAATKSAAMASSEAQRQTLIESLRLRYSEAVRREDAEAKQALFKEAVYLGIQPDLFTGEG
jgi:hypothetical protein